MLRSTPEWEEYERDYLRNEPKGWHANVADFVMLLDHAEYMGAFPLDNPLEGIEDDIRLAKALSVPLKPPRLARGHGEAAEQR